MRQLPQISVRTEKGLRKRLEQIFTVYALLFCAGAFASMFSQGLQLSDEKPPTPAMAAIQKLTSSRSGDPTQANPVFLAGQISVYVVVAALLLHTRRDALLQIRNTKLLWAIVALAFVSVLWSDAPAWALRRCVNLAATCGFGLYLGYRYSPRQLLRLLGWTLLVAIVCSIVVVAILPDRGLDSAMTNHAWKGIFVQKNTLGRLMALGVVVFSFLASENKAHRWRYAAASLLCAGMIVAARSATSAMAVPILVMLVWLFALARQRSVWLVFPSALVALVGFACAVLLFVDTEDLLLLLGRDATLSGRLEIWNAVLPKIMEHPWLGYGYSSFWMGLESKPSADLWSILGWHVPHSHNGFLDLAAELGFVGLGLFLIGFFVSMKYGLQWARSQRGMIGLWPLAYLSFMFLFNLSESSILKQDNIFWALYVATTVFVVNQARKVQPEAAKVRTSDLQQPVMA
jgi:O-antigen ligase